MSADLAKLAAPELAARWDKAGRKLAAALTEVAYLHAELERRYRPEGEKLLGDRSTGTVHVIDGGLDVGIEFPARETTDQALAQRAIGRAIAAGANWEGVVDVKVKRSALGGLPPVLQRMFRGAVTRRPGKLVFTLRPAKPRAEAA